MSCGSCTVESRKRERRGLYEAASLCDHGVQMLLATVGAFAAFSHIITFFYTFLCLLCAGVLACLRSGTYLSRSGTSRIEKNMNIKKSFLRND